MRFLAELSTKNDYWIKIVRNFGENDYAEDVVQEMYLKIADLIERKIITEQPPTSYIYLTLRSLTADLQRQQKKVIRVGLEDIKGLENEDSDIDENEFEEKQTAIEIEMSKWHWYDRKLFLLYINGNYSLRKLSDETGIDWWSIKHTVLKCKKRLKWINEQEHTKNGKPNLTQNQKELEIR
jgi:RNA polymerase sigma factor (sigma-70 family)